MTPEQLAKELVSPWIYNRPVDLDQLSIAIADVIRASELCEIIRDLRSQLFWRDGRWDGISQESWDAETERLIAEASSSPSIQSSQAASS